MSSTPPVPGNIMCQMWGQLWFVGFWSNPGSCLGVACTANPAQFRWKWSELAVLFSRQLPKGSHNFSQIFSIFKNSFKYLRTHKPQLPLHFDTYYSRYRWCARVVYPWSKECNSWFFLGISIISKYYMANTLIK